MALTPMEKVMKARINLLVDSPFFGHLLVRFKYLMKRADDPEDKQTCKTMSVDRGGTIRFYDKFVEELSEAELTGVLCHEVMHVALEHLLRTPRRIYSEPHLFAIFNMAIDLVVNAILLAEGMQLPAKSKDGGEYIIPHATPDKGWCYTFKHYNVTVTNIMKRSAEEVYHVLLRALPPQLTLGLPSGFDSHEFGGAPLDQDEAERLGREWSGHVAEAAAAARSKGKLPGGLSGLLDKVNDAKVNWRARLWQFVQSHAVSGFTWGRPCRRAIASGVYLPSPFRENLELVISADSSGSISQECLATQIGEAQAIVKSMDR